ncbi:MAG: PAS domain-containing sensor histidine kinase [Alteromonadaceae bacterium]|nr:MAG: PAS domain-containing sensor histidine kinase [Alteromonadaceae bacterium]
MIEQSTDNEILDTLITAIVVLDDQLNILRVNTSAEALLGASSEQLISKHISLCFSLLDGTPKALQDALNERKDFTQRKISWKLHHDREVTIDYSVTSDADNGQIILEIQPLDRLIKISREEAWISSQETSRNLIKSMAHEIKNPLGGIRGAAQLLSRELAYDSTLDEYTKIIIHETDRLRNLVDRLLGPRTPPKFVELNIHEVLEHVISVIELEALGQISIKRDYDPSIPMILGDHDQLIQAFLNIARNAMQALLECNETNENGKKITISTRIKRRYTIGRNNYPLVARVSIIDTGPGIPDDIVEDIFFPMITGRAEGSGLGLSISQNLIGQHQGLIECNNEPGATEFAVYLPLGQNYEQK